MYYVVEDYGNLEKKFRLARMTLGEEEHATHKKEREQTGEWRPRDLRMKEMARRRREEQEAPAFEKAPPDPTADMPKGIHTRETALKLVQKSEPKYSSVQADLPEDIAGWVRGLETRIDPAHFHPTEKQDDVPHITVRYGLHDNNAVGVTDMLSGLGPVSASITGVDIFKPEDKDYEVLVMTVDSPDLCALNQGLAFLPHTNTFPVYRPHCTIAYLVKGVGDGYKTFVTGLEGRVLTFDKVMFSNHDQKKTEIPLVRALAKVPEPQYGLFAEVLEDLVGDEVTKLVKKLVKVPAGPKHKAYTRMDPREKKVKSTVDERARQIYKETAWPEGGAGRGSWGSRWTAWFEVVQKNGDTRSVSITADKKTDLLPKIKEAILKIEAQGERVKLYQTTEKKTESKFKKNDFILLKPDAEPQPSIPGKKYEIPQKYLEDGGLWAVDDYEPESGMLNIARVETPYPGAYCSWIHEDDVIKKSNSTPQSKMQKMVDDFVPFCAKYLKLKNIPKIKFVGPDQAKKIKAFGQHLYTKGKPLKPILLDVEDRHPMDILRTLAHELVHHKQDTEGGESSGATSVSYRGNKKENEANKIAGILVRNWAVKHPEYFELGAVKKSQTWIGVDLDGTLAAYQGWRGGKEIGKPVVPMVKRIKKWIEQGKKVKIFTARAAHGKEAIQTVKDWLKENDLPDLEVTNEKDHLMEMLYDDRVIQVKRNTGELVKCYVILEKAKVRGHWATIRGKRVWIREYDTRVMKRGKLGAVSLYHRESSVEKILNLLKSLLKTVGVWKKKGGLTDEQRQHVRRELRRIQPQIKLIKKRQHVRAVADALTKLRLEIDVKSHKKPERLDLGVIRMTPEEREIAEHMKKIRRTNI